MEPWKEELCSLSQTQVGKRNNWSRNTMGVSVVTARGSSNVPHISPQSPLPQHTLSLLGHRTSTLARQSQHDVTGTLGTFEGDSESLENVCQTSSPQDLKPEERDPEVLGVVTTSGGNKSVGFSGNSFLEAQPQISYKEVREWGHIS